jgi:hypothetical protein
MPTAPIHCTFVCFVLCMHAWCRLHLLRGIIEAGLTDSRFGQAAYATKCTGNSAPDPRGESEVVAGWPSPLVG